MSKKQPKQNKTKEQLVWEIKQKAEAQRKRAFIAEHLYPMLLKHMKNVTQAKNFCKVVQNDILSTFNQGMTGTVKGLDMSKRLDGINNEAADAYRAALEIFADSPINEALELLDGMPNAIDAALNQESKDRPLADLEWGDGMLTIKKHD
jgi:hypothetical protein